jgi:hypothetical protein
MSNPSKHGIWQAPPWRAVTGDNGETDIDLDAADYTAYVLLLTIANPSARNFIDDCYVYFDLDKATTGWGAVATSQTLALAVARKIDGTNYRIDANTNLGLESPAMTGSVAAVTRGMGLHVGPIGPSEDCQIFVRLSTEAAVSGDVEIPYIVYYQGPAPTITEVEA